MKFEDEKRYIGNLDQLMRVKKIRMEDGKADSVQMLDVQNASGLHFYVNISRGMDIPYIDYKGENLAYISPSGIVSPTYFDDKGLGFLKSFTAGFLTTCGLKMAGAPCDYENNSYGLHGNISHIPAEEISYKIVENEENPYINIEGKMRDGIIFGDRLVLRRNIKCFYKDKKILLHDRVKNEGYKRSRHMILYHCNLGYPLLSPDTELFIPSIEVRARDKHAKKYICEWETLQESDSDFREMCYYHKLQGDDKGYSSVAVYNPHLNMGLSIKFKVTTLDYFVQWKMMGAGDYVLGLEPSNTTIDGISDAVENGSMKYLDAQEEIDYYLEFCILNGREEFDAIKLKYGR